MFKGICSTVLLAAGFSALAGCVDGSEPRASDSELVAQVSSSDTQSLRGGFVFAGTNAAQNGVARYRRTSDGRLEFLGVTPTGGRGTDAKIIPSFTASGPDPLISQHSVALNATHTVLMVVNAGDDTVTSFRVGPLGTLSNASRVSSGGHIPNSIAIRGDLAYVANAGDAANGVAASIIGFRIGSYGDLHRIARATGTFTDPGAQPAHVLFTPDGTRLVVTEVFTQKIDVFPVHADASLGAATVNASSGGAPFGMTFASNDTLLVSEAVGAVAGAATVSSYQLSGTHLTPVTSTLASGESGACWFSITPDGRFAYATNTGSADHPSSISIYSVAASGALAFVNAAAVPRPAAPGSATSGGVDSMITSDGRYLYQLYSGLGIVGAFRIGSDGGLPPVADGDAGGLPMLGTEGLHGF
jgi:6-phosphogluconolactonase (cycloisomerase 2 family)